jgi:hypothetical protein
MRNERTMQKIMTAFAEAVAAGDFDRAEGWLAVARFSHDRIPTLDPEARSPSRRHAPA